jgi:ABC-2 type transport system permease protein
MMEPRAARPAVAAWPAPVLRRFGPVNWVGLYALYRRELLRVLKFYPESVFGPTAMSLLYLIVFHFALGGEGVTMGGLPLIEFVAPGLVIYTLCERAFDTTSISLLFDKLEGMISDILMAPLSAAERTAAYAGSAASAGFVVGGVVLAAQSLFVPLSFANPAAILFFAVAGALLHALAGIIVGLWAARWDHYAAATTFFVVPFGFLSGTFYSIEALPPLGRLLVQLNPVFYVIDGFRYGFTGHAEGSLAIGVALLLVVDAVLLVVVYRLVRRGFRLKP